MAAHGVGRVVLAGQHQTRGLRFLSARSIGLCALALGGASTSRRSRLRLGGRGLGGLAQQFAILARLGQEVGRLILGVPPLIPDDGDPDEIRLWYRDKRRILGLLPALGRENEGGQSRRDENGAEGSVVTRSHGPLRPPHEPDGYADHERHQGAEQANEAVPGPLRLGQRDWLRGVRLGRDRDQVLRLRQPVDAVEDEGP